MKKILSFTYLLLLTIGLTGCDSSLFNELFRNPHIVEIGHLDNMEADKWYEFRTEIKALNHTQNIIVSFDGSAPDELTYNHLDSSGVSLNYQSSLFPEKSIDFELLAYDEGNKEYKFRPSGQSKGIIFIDEHNIPLQKETLKLFKIKSNLKHKNIHITWISRTGK